jgi:Tol biopolymer transport system component
MVVCRRAVRVIGVAALVLLNAACAGERAGVESGLNKIVFASDRAMSPQPEEDGYDTRRLELYVMDADGGHVTRLTDNRATDAFPTISPDGRRIAFTRDIGRFAQVFVMDTRGGHVRMLTHGRANSGLPAWSPDGRRIAFATDRNAPEEGDEIYVMNADGSAQRPVTRNLHSTDDAWPSWAPDGKRIVFARETPGAAAIYVVNADSTGLRRLTRDKQALDTQPAWSPDGKQIVYESDIFMLPGQIFVMRADGTQRRQLTDPTVGASSRPSWSSDGRQIVFMASRARHTAVWTMRADGTRQKQLTRGRGFDGFPAAG